MDYSSAFEELWELSNSIDPIELSNITKIACQREDDRWEGWNDYYATPEELVGEDYEASYEAQSYGG